MGNKDIKILLIVAIPTLIISIVLIYFGLTTEGIITIILGLVVWSITTMVKRYFKRLDAKVDEQKQILLQGTQASYGYKQSVLIDMYNVTKVLWKKSIWIGNNWNALWPGHDDKPVFRDNFNTKLNGYKKFLKINSIIIPSEIYKKSVGIVDGINQYQLGRIEWSAREADEENRKHGSAEMSEGSKLVQSSIVNLFELIRNKFELKGLPSDILEIKQPKNIEE